jgi:hypothetical protein
MATSSSPSTGKFVNLVYVGQIRDKNSSQIVREPAYFMVTDKLSGMTFPFVNDRPGHYRSPDIGESVRELAGNALDPSNLEFELSIAGYKNVKLTNAPRKSMGVVELNFKVEREDAPVGTAARTGTAAREPVDHSVQAPTAATDAASIRSRLLFMGAAAFTIIAGAAVRTSGRRRSTAG